MYDYFVNNFGVLVCSVGLIIMLLFNRGSKRDLKSTMLIIALSLLILTVTESTERSLGYAGDHSRYRIFLAVSGYILRSLPMYCLIMYLCRSSKARLLFSIPILLDVVVCAINLWYPILFRYDDTGYFIRGPLGYFTHAVGLLYMVIMLERTIRLFKERSIQEAIIILYVSAVTVVALCMETFGLSEYLISTAMAAGFLMYYMFMQVQFSSRDPLTNLLNRSAFYSDSEKRFTDIRGIISIDMNELKWINDTKGHAAGDEALKTVSTALHDGLGSKFPLYRVGGDEFVAICYVKEIEKAKEAIERARAELAKTPYCCAFGLSFEDDGVNISIDTHLKNADIEMYEDKKRLKEEAEANGTALHLRE
ncbi:MAG: GGDEF domain-containing protein [Lachnospiraceae bacterium]|nr:GGDEF domain-containing protein [Lachnospiraceae bacterium]